MFSSSSGSDLEGAGANGLVEVTPFVRLDITSSDPLPILLVHVKALAMVLCTPLTVAVAVQVRMKRLWGEIFSTQVPSVGILTKLDLNTNCMNQQIKIIELMYANF